MNNKSSINLDRLNDDLDSHDGVNTGGVNCSIVTNKKNNFFSARVIQSLKVNKPKHPKEFHQVDQMQDSLKRHVFVRKKIVVDQNPTQINT